MAEKKAISDPAASDETLCPGVAPGPFPPAASTAETDITLPPWAAAPPATAAHAKSTQPPGAKSTFEDIGSTVSFTEGDKTLPLVAASSQTPTLESQPPKTLVAGAATDDATLHADPLHTKDFHKAAIASAPKARVAGAAFGDYQLIEPIAKGGMGIVYKARQRKLNRIVAIKMILAGQFADQSDIDRFYAEAESAAALSHPNIVAIHEVGEVEGQHFFSMDYIEGESLAALVQENPLPARRAAELVRTIAETMQFAHDSGIVHRDLKPSNVLLDKKQRPLITDFGLAKQVSNQSQLTMAGSIVGTPSYMPPEQAAGKLDEIGPWSDLYSLGAILYELLTGRPPFRAASPFETIRQVLETDPPSPRLLNPQIPRDLETICLKCLQKAIPNRYAKAQDLADELGRFLAGEPIQARPISQVARFWRLCKRNPVTSSAIALAATFFVAASIVSTVAYIRTSAALSLANERTRAAITAVNDFFTTVSEETLLNKPGMQPLRENLLAKSKGYYELLMKQGYDPAIEVELAGAYFRLGQTAVMLKSPGDALEPYAKARDIQTRMVRRHPADFPRLKELGDTVQAIGNVWFEKKNYPKARQAYADAVEIRRQLVAANANDGEYQRVLANTYMNLGKADFDAAQVTTDDKEYDALIGEARQQYVEAQKLREAALKLTGVNDNTRSKLRRDLAKGYFSLGNLEWINWQRAEAIGHMEQAVSVFEQLASDDPADLETQKFLAICARMLGDFQCADHPDEARRRYQQALARLDPLATENPDVLEYQHLRAALYMNLSLLETESGKAAAAHDALQLALADLAHLAQKAPGVPSYQRDLAATLMELAKIELAGGDAAQAAEHRDRAIQVLSSLVKLYPAEAGYADLLKETQAITIESAPPK